MDTLATIFSIVKKKDIETGARGFALTGNKSLHRNKCWQSQKIKKSNILHLQNLIKR
jgi:hypothetical protein